MQDKQPTPLPRKPTGKLAFAYQTIASLEQARADLEAEVQQWKSVFGHLGTADECGNEWIRLQDENQRLREALEEIVSYEHDWETLVEDLRHIAHEALEKRP